MKSVIISAFLVLSFSSSAFAVCSIYPDGAGTDLGGGQMVYKNTPIFGVPGAQNSSDAFDGPIASMLARDEFIGGGCGAAGYCESPDFRMVILSIHCSTAWVQAKMKFEDTVMASSTITGVPVGNEKDAAELYFQDFDANNSYPEVTGNVRTDGFKGYSYTAAEGEEEGYSDVTITAWKRGGYTSPGNTTSLESLSPPEGSGGGGLTAEQTTDAFAAALGQKNLSASEFEQSMKDAFDYAHTQGYLSEGGSGGLSQADTTEAFQDAIGNYTEESPELKTSDGTLPSSNGNDSMPEGFDTFAGAPERDSLTERFATFLINNPLVSIFTESEINVSSGSCSFDGSVYGRTITFSFCPYADLLGIMGSGVMLLAGAFSIFIILGRS